MTNPFFLCAVCQSCFTSLPVCEGCDRELNAERLGITAAELEDVIALEVMSA